MKNSQIVAWGWYSDYDSKWLRSSIKKIANCSHSSFQRALIRFFNIFNSYLMHRYVKLINRNNISRAKLVIFSDDILYYPSILDDVRKSGIIIFRNTINDNLFRLAEPYITRNRIVCYSFDNGDCARYDINFLNQFLPYTKTVSRHKSSDRGIFFIGRDKGRKELISKVIENSILTNSSNFIDIINDKRRFIAPWRRQSYSYDCYLDIMIQYPVILDIVKEGQCGLTLRALESIHYQKLLITNNHNILSWEKYSPDRIFVLGYNEISELNKFLSKRKKLTNDKLPQKYYGSSVLDQLIECHF